MRNYQFSFLDMMARAVGEQRHQAADDDDALASARMLAFGHGVEVWQGKRRVGIVWPSGDTLRIDSSEEP